MVSWSLQKRWVLSSAVLPFLLAILLYLSLVTRKKVSGISTIL